MKRRKCLRNNIVLLLGKASKFGGPSIIVRINKNYTMKLIQYGGDVPMSALIVSIPFMKQFME